MIVDEVFRLIFTACHPVLAVKGRVALTLRRLGRMLVEFLREESEVYGLRALMELQASRRGPTGEAVLLPEQGRLLWDHAQIQRGVAAVASRIC